MSEVTEINPSQIKSQSDLHFRLSVFEGPLDLLLHLIKENKIDIYDIPIVHITRQYVDYLEVMKELNLEIAGEFLVMAATLRSLLFKCFEFSLKKNKCQVILDKWLI